MQFGEDSRAFDNLKGFVGTVGILMSSLGLNCVSVNATGSVGGYCIS